MPTEKTEADYRIAPIDWTIQDAITANLTENLAREDLSTYELAMQCKQLREEYNMSAKDISAKVRAHDSEAGDRKPLSEAHINNLMRCASELHPDILKAWQDGHPKASLRLLIQLAAEKDPDAQLRQWRGVENPEQDEEGEGDEGGEGGGKSGSDKPARRPTAAQLAVMIEAVKTAGKNGKRSEEFVRGAVAALQYAAGVKANIPGVKMDETKEGGEE